MGGWLSGSKLGKRAQHIPEWLQKLLKMEK